MVKFSFGEVAPCLFAIFIDVMGFGLISPLLVTIFSDPNHNIFHISTDTLRYLSLGITLALFPLLMFFGTSFIGDLSDIIGRKKTLLISMAGMTIGFFIMGIGIISSNFTLFLCGRGISGLVAASQSVALATISDLSTPENKTIHLSYVALIQCVGFVIGPLIGGVLSSFALDIPFYGAALFALVAFLWIAFAFEETFVKKGNKTFSFFRIFQVFVEAYQNKRILRLCIAFLAMQIGISLYLPVILVLLNTSYGYSTLSLGLFNGYLGLGFGIGLLIFLPKMLKRYQIEQAVAICLFITVAAQFLSSIIHSEILIWVLAFPLAIAVEIAFSGMFTSFSNAADETSQGWVMGISVAVMAIAWALTGFGTQLIPLIGASGLICIGSIVLAVSAFLMRRYCALHLI